MNYASSQNHIGGEVYGGSGVQSSNQIFFDKIGNRFQVISYNNYFTADSNGHQINIPSIGGNLTKAIIKYDSNGIFQYCFRTSASNTEPIDIKFDNQNNLYVLNGFAQVDSLLIYNKNAQLYRNVKAIYIKKSGESRAAAAYALIKLTNDGNLLWVNTIYKENIPSGNLGSRSSVTINNNGGLETIKLFFVNTRLNSGTPDTISYLNNAGAKNSILVTTQNVILNYTTDGVFLSGNEPFKNRLLFNQKDSLIPSFSYSKDAIIVSDGTSNFIYLNMFFNSNDTFQSNPKIPIEYGINYFILKTNENDSLIWIKPLYKLKETIGFYSKMFTNLDIDILKSTIIFNLIFSKTSHVSIFKPSLNTINSHNNFRFKLNYEGNILFTDSFIFGTNLLKHSFNPLNRKHVSLGQILGSDPRFINKIPSYLQNKIFNGILEVDDSTNTVSSIIPILANIDNPSSNIFLYYSNEFGGMVDSKGKVFASGQFNDSIILPCKNLYATKSDTNQFGFKLTDAFTIYFEPIKQLFVNSCYPYTSPSNKFIWDSSGVYLDTILSSFGCDSILKIHLSINNNQINIDTAVKYNLISPSKKYTWDSTGLYIDSLINLFGCDSILFINLRVLNNKNKLDTFNCNPISYWSKNQTIRQSGTYHDTIPNSLGGDSILTIHFKLGSSQSSLDTSNCGPINSLSGKYLYTQSGQYVDTIPNSLFCDSVVTINYTRTPTKDTIYISSCTPYAGVSGKLAVFSDGLYLDTLTSTLGCDSILYVFFSSLNTSSTIQIKSCDSVVSPSKKYVFGQSGLYQDTLKNQFNCDSVITIQLSVEPLNIAVSKSNNITCDSPFAQLEVTGGTIFKWWPETGLNNHQIFNPIANPENNIWYYVLVRTEIGCEASDSIELLVNKDPEEQEIANVFTPNNDGINDCFPIEGIAKFIEVEIEIFNRWGATLFKSNNPKACWDGYAPNGQKASEGTYFYVLSGKSTCHQNVQLHGTITLIR